MTHNTLKKEGELLYALMTPFGTKHLSCVSSLHFDLCIVFFLKNRMTVLNTDNSSAIKMFWDF